jgi:RES domain-containing protein
MILYRLVKCEYAEDLSGTGARLFGGRWNSEGKPALYLASSRSLAILEVLVHLPPLMIPDNYCLVDIEVPDKNISPVHIHTKNLPSDWKDMSPPNELKKIGDDFLKQRMHLLLQLPSAIVPSEYNYLLNPLNEHIKEVRIVHKTSFEFDQRLALSKSFVTDGGETS